MTLKPFVNQSLATQPSSVSLISDIHPALYAAPELFRSIAEFEIPGWQVSCSPRVIRQKLKNFFNFSQSIPNCSPSLGLLKKITVTEHMPKERQKYLKWNGNRFRKWAERIASDTCRVVNAILVSPRVEQQSYRNCMVLIILILYVCTF